MRVNKIEKEKDTLENILKNKETRKKSTTIASNTSEVAGEVADAVVVSNAYFNVLSATGDVIVAGAEATGEIISSGLEAVGEAIGSVFQ